VRDAEASIMSKSECLRTAVLYGRITYEVRNGLCPGDMVFSGTWTLDAVSLSGDIFCLITVLNFSSLLTTLFSFHQGSVALLETVAN
jgi:hypothetical protein